MPGNAEILLKHTIAKSSECMSMKNLIKVFGNFQMEIFPLFASVKSFENLLFRPILVIKQILQFSNGWKFWVSHPIFKAF